LEDVLIAEEGADEQESAAASEERLFYRIVQPNGEQGDPVKLDLQLRDQLVERFKKLPNNVYRIYYREAGANTDQLLYELHVIDNKIVPSDVFEESEEAPDKILEQDLELDGAPRPNDSPSESEPSGEVQLDRPGDWGEPVAVEVGGELEQAGRRLPEWSAVVMTPLAASSLAAATLIAGAPAGSWRRRVEHAMESGAACFGKTARLLRRLRDT
jgi:hypothetical protein